MVYAQTPKTILIIIDGIPSDLIESVSTPGIDAVAGESGYTRSWVGGERGGESESPTVSAVGYNHLITGTWSNKHNVYNNRIDEPNYDYWDLFRIAKTHDASLHTAIFSTWTDNRTKLIGDGLPEAGGTKLDYAFDGFEHDTDQFPHDLNSDYIRQIDTHVSRETARYVRDIGPDVSWVYLQYSDDIGHRYGDGPEMNQAITFMDARVGEIWDAVREREQNTDEDWLVIVTTDHGRDSLTGRHHGGQSERERTIWIATNHDKLNAHFHASPPLVDVLPSIVQFMDLDMVPSVRAALDGQSFID